MPKITINNQEVETQEESFQTIREDWSEYELASGVRVRIKPVVHKIARVLDKNGKPAFQKDGDPYVLVRHQVQIVTSGEPVPDTDEEVH